MFEKRQMYVIANDLERVNKYRINKQFDGCEIRTYKDTTDDIMIYVFKEDELKEFIASLEPKTERRTYGRTKKKGRKKTTRRNVKKRALDSNKVRSHEESSEQSGESSIRKVREPGNGDNRSERAGEEAQEEA